MIYDFLHDVEFSELMSVHMKEILDLLLSRGEFFAILTNVAEITFDPPLPSHITQSFKPITLFVIAEYTFETCSFDEDNLYFEAGFGHENIGSFVTLPLSAIVQILLENTPIFINLSHAHKKRNNKVAEIETSTNIFLSNPLNKNLIKN